MNFQNTNKPLKVVISVGDESGIGPEIILKALCSNEIPENIEFKLVGSKKNLQNTYEHLKSLGLENLANPKNLKIQDLEISPSNNDLLMTMISCKLVQSQVLNWDIVLQFQSLLLSIGNLNRRNLQYLMEKFRDPLSLNILDLQGFLILRI